MQQRRLLGLEGAVGVGVLPKLADHRELGMRHHKKKEREKESERGTQDVRTRLKMDDTATELFAYS